MLPYSTVNPAAHWQSSVPKSPDVLVVSSSSSSSSSLSSSSGVDIPHLYRPGLDGRPTYAHGDENPLQRAESVGQGVYINTGGKVLLNDHFDDNQV